MSSARPGAQGGVQHQILGPDFTDGISAAMAAGMAAENRRRDLSSGSPGLGSLVELPELAYGPGVGKSGLLTTVGEGCQVTPPDAPWQAKSYGPGRPQYAPGEVGGSGYAPGAVQQYVSDLGNRVFNAQDARAAAGPGVEVVSPQAAPRRSMLGRMLGRLRRR